MGTAIMTWFEPFRSAEAAAQTMVTQEDAATLRQYAFCAEEVLERARQKPDSGFLLEYAPALMAYNGDPVVLAFRHSLNRNCRAA